VAHQSTLVTATPEPGTSGGSSSFLQEESHPNPHGKAAGQPSQIRQKASRSGGPDDDPSSDDDSSSFNSRRQHRAARGSALPLGASIAPVPWNADESASSRRPEMSVALQAWMKTFSTTLAKRAVRYPGDTRFLTTKAEWIRLVQSIARDDARIFDKIDILFPIAFEGDAYAAMEKVFGDPNYAMMSIEEMWHQATRICWSEGQRDAIRLAYEDKSFDMTDRSQTIERYKEDIRSLGTALRKDERELMDQFVRGIRDEKLREAARYYSMEHAGIDSLAARVQRHLDDIRTKRKAQANPEIPVSTGMNRPIHGGFVPPRTNVFGHKKIGQFRRIGEKLQLVGDEGEEHEAPDEFIPEQALDELVNEFVNKLSDRVDVSRVICYTCNQAGHISRDCPSKGVKPVGAGNPKGPKT
jgi:hypothetical protein